MQNYLVFQPIKIYFKVISGVGNGSYIYYWKSKGLSDDDKDDDELFLWYGWPTNGI